MDRFVAISGCSGGGKSTLLGELARRGHSTVEEPGRRIVAEERAKGGQALPWVDMAAFARRAMDLALADRRDAEQKPGVVFFDRGLVDAAVALVHAGGGLEGRDLVEGHRYNRTVFLTPPWPAIYRQDDARRHDLGAAVAEYDRLRLAYAALGYSCVILPHAGVAARADLVCATLGLR